MQKCVKWTRKEENRERVSRSHTFIFKILTVQNAYVRVCERWVYFLIYISLQNNLITSNLFPPPPPSSCARCEKGNRKDFFTCVKRKWIDGNNFFAYRQASDAALARAWAFGFYNQKHLQFGVCTIKIRHIIIKWWSDNPCTVYVSSPINHFHLPNEHKHPSTYSAWAGPAQA